MFEQAGKFTTDAQVVVVLLSQLLPVPLLRAKGSRCGR
jgi:hypothetical protein